MKINELMTKEPRSVRTSDRLDAAARVLWDQDCGIVPVIDAAGVLAGVVTDRDLCMAVYTQGRLLTEIPVSAVMARAVRTARADEPVATALQTMAQAQVHRLPVVDARGMLVGILSTSDLVRQAHSRPAALDVGGVVKVLAAIVAPRRLAAPAAPSAAAPQAERIAPAAAAATAAAQTPVAQTPVAQAPVAHVPVKAGKAAPKKPKGKKG